MRQEPAHVNRTQEARLLLPVKSLERLLLTRLMPVNKGKIFQRPRSFFSADKKLNLNLSQSISGNTIGLGMLLAFSVGKGCCTLR